MFHRERVDKIFRVAENGDIEEANRLFRQALDDARSGRLKSRRQMDGLCLLALAAFASAGLGLLLSI